MGWNFFVLWRRCVLSAGDPSASSGITLRLLLRVTPMGSEWTQHADFDSLCSFGRSSRASLHLGVA